MAPRFGSISPQAPEDDLLQQYTDPMGAVVGVEPNRKRPNWMMEPDLLGTLTGQMPEGVGLDESGQPFYRDTGEKLTMVPRPGMLPIAKTPEGLTLAKPKIWDVASYLVGGPVPAGAGEEVLGAGAMIKSGVRGKKIGAKPTPGELGDVPEGRKAPAATEQPPAETPPTAFGSLGKPAINWNRTRTQLGGAAVGDRTVMEVPIDALDSAYRLTDPGMHVATPRKQVLEHMAAGNEISLPEVYVGRQNYPINWWQLGYVNGRNRVAAAKALGAETVPVVVEPGHEDAFRQLIERHSNFMRDPRQGAMPQLAERYPEVGPPTLTYKETGKPVPAEDIPTGAELERRLALPKKDPQAVYHAKEATAEAEQLAKVRKQMKPDIESGNYSPYFPPQERADIDPSEFGPYHDTTQNVMKKPLTREQYDLAASNPEAVRRLTEAYEHGLKQSDAAGNWYYMKQLLNEFVNEYGPEHGREMFKERFADAMAATTGGADPTANLLMAHYGNFLKQHGMEVPASHQMPYPIGGQYAANNMEQFRKMIMEGEGIDPLSNEKRYNFSGNFLGRKRQATVDEQMSGLFFPGDETPPPGLEGVSLFKKGMDKPPPGSYGHFEKVLQMLADQHGVDPRYFQEVAWAGHKDLTTKGGYAAKPMISHVNDAIERTHRVTGMPRAEIVRRGLVRGQIPLYSPGGAGFAASFGSLAPKDERQ